MRFIQAASQEQIDQARAMFREYETWMDKALCFRDFEKELTELPGVYAPEDGRLLLGFFEDKLAGCVALRRLDENTCEMRRLFLRLEFHGKGLGRELAQKIIDEARSIGYTKMRLNTLPGKMDKALALYRSFGFREIPTYTNYPIPGAMFLELELKGK
jgi:GNAT superfamily N-acetyltransferase